MSNSRPESLTRGSGDQWRASGGCVEFQGFTTLKPTQQYTRFDTCFIRERRCFDFALQPDERLRLLIVFAHAVDYMSYLACIKGRFCMPRRMKVWLEEDLLSRQRFRKQTS
tara:strand:- start:31 stop:363 length:333 start_codon:yes stop_codon:yes gene_type:complete